MLGAVPEVAAIAAEPKLCWHIRVPALGAVLAILDTGSAAPDTAGLGTVPIDSDTAGSDSVPIDYDARRSHCRVALNA